jgi:hypothetical protein
MYKRIKKDSKWSIIDQGQFKIDGILNEILGYTDEWFLDLSRQALGAVHTQTQMYRICETDYAWAPGTPIETFYRNDLKTHTAQEELSNIFKYLEDFYSGTVIRCEIIKLLPNSEVLKHTDGGALLHYSRRVHIPILTNKKITFTVMNNTVHMEKGRWYEINNQMPHSVSNPTDQERIHIIIDILPDEMLQLTHKEQQL